MGYLLKHNKNNKKLGLEFQKHITQIRTNGHYNINKKITEILSNNTFLNQKVFIIGGGESLKNFDFNLLKEQKIITINLAFMYCPWATINYSMDPHLYDKILNVVKEEEKGQLNKKHNLNIEQLWDSFNGIRVFLTPLEDKPKKFGNEVYLIRRICERVINKNIHSGIYGGSNSATGALMLAIALGATEIYLLGYDFKCTTQSHFHAGYDNRNLERFNNKLQQYLEEITVLSAKITNEGIKVYNCNSNSKLQCFPFVDINEVLNAPIS